MNTNISKSYCTILLHEYLSVCLCRIVCMCIYHIHICVRSYIIGPYMSELHIYILYIFVKHGGNSSSQGVQRRRMPVVRLLIVTLEALLVVLIPASVLALDLYIFIPFISICIQFPIYTYNRIDLLCSYIYIYTYHICIQYMTIDI